MRRGRRCRSGERAHLALGGTACSALEQDRSHSVRRTLQGGARRAPNRSGRELRRPRPVMYADHSFMGAFLFVACGLVSCGPVRLIGPPVRFDGVGYCSPASPLRGSVARPHSQAVKRANGFTRSASRTGWGLIRGMRRVTGRSSWSSDQVVWHEPGCGLAGAAGPGPRPPEICF
jgi:hypothetical protein